MSYPWIKTLHILFVMAWMASVFYLPRILVNIAEAGDAAAVRERLLLMGRRLYGFGHIMFGFMLLFGLTLWLHFKIGGTWMHIKLTLVALLLAYYIVTGRYLKKAAAGAVLPGSKFFRWYNEIALVLAIPIIYLAVSKAI
jgi:protoporphyrinogen IX oxidase